jgi:K+-sensing histidine kinase KdpD
VEASRNSSNGGVGLGLSIVKRTVLLHGGSVTAVNARPGLLVVVRLPVSAANDPRAQSDRPSVTQNSDQPTDVNRVA